MPVQTTFRPRDLFSSTGVYPARPPPMRRFCGHRPCLCLAFILTFYVAWHALKWPDRYSRYRRISAEKLAYKRALTHSLPLFENTQICSLDAVDLIWIIVSSSSHFHERQAIRETWASMPDLFSVHSQRLFVVGYHAGERFYQNLIDEARYEQDLLYLTTDDRSVTLKELHAYRWAEQHCGYVQYTFKVEDDLFVNSLLVHELIRELNTKQGDSKNLRLYNIQLDVLFRARLNSETKRFLFGWAFQPAQPERNNTASPYYVTQKEYSKPLYPQYCSGFGYLMDAKTRNILASQGLADLQPFRFADIFITGIVPERMNFACETLPFTYHQGSVDQCQQMLKKSNIKEPSIGSLPPLLICSTGQHTAENNLADYFQIWRTLRRVYADRIPTNEG